MKLPIEAKGIPNLDENGLLSIRYQTFKHSSNKENQVIVGPYISVNSLKNDYIKLKRFGFEELDIFLND